MVKKTLIALALVALLATSVQAALKEYHFEEGDHAAVKVDGSDSVRWPWSYKALPICSIPIKMKIGMYVQVIDCGKKKLILEQVPCADISKGDGDYPCYRGCVDYDVRANFDVKMGADLEKVGNIIDSWEKDPAFKGEDVVPKGGGTTNVKVCVRAWKAKIYNHEANDEVEVGKLNVTVKPNV